LPWGLLGLAFAGTEALAPTPLLFKQKQFAFVASAIGQIARRQPTVLWIEDVHWLDPSSAELLLEVVRGLADTSLLVLLTTRSFPRGPTLPKADEVIDLKQLGPQECLELVRSIPGAHALPDEVLSRAVDAGEGVPLFIEQLVLSLIDERAQAPGRFNKGLPLTLAEMMSERLDRLPEGRRVVQAAACIGRSFTPDFLSALLKEDAGKMLMPLEELVEAEILRPTPYGAETRFEFRHALLQRMAYESMVQAERRSVHRRIVQVLKQGGRSAPSIPEVMAHHLTEAAEFHDAIKTWLAAGQAAATRSAHLEAIEHFRRGLGLLDRVPEPELRREMELSLQAGLIGSLSPTQGATSADFS
jgi:predicted ATPase